MKIIQMIPNFCLGGAESMCRQLAVSLKNNGHDVKAITFYHMDTKNTEELKKAGVEIECLNKELGFSIATIKKLRAIIKEFKPDVIHTHLSASRYAFLATLGSKTPIIHTVHSVAQYESEGLSKKINKVLLKFKRVKFVALNELVQKSISEVYGIDEKNTPIVLNGIDLSHYKPKKNRGIEKTVKIIQVASFQPVKNQVELIKAIKRLNDAGYDCKLLLCGDGVCRPQIEATIKDLCLEDAVELAGMRTDIPDLLNQSDIFVLPSILEGMPMSIIEAMATALPIVASNVGGIPNMITDGKQGLLCEPNEKSIGDCLERYIKDEKLREACASAALERSKDFSVENMTEGYLNLYKR